MNEIREMPQVPEKPPPDQALEDRQPQAAFRLEVQEVPRRGSRVQPAKEEDKQEGPKGDAVWKAQEKIENANRNSTQPINRKTLL